MNRMEQIEQIVKELLTKLSFENTQVEVFESDQSYQIQIKLEVDQSILIGQAGAHLAALQHIVRLLLRKSLGSQVEVSKEVYIDVNGYWREKERKLTEEAKERAQQVLTTGDEQVLPFMEAHDRRIIHGALVDIEGIQTESFGVGRERRIRIFRSKNKEA